MQRILIVDDESRIRRIYRRFLEPRGYRVFESADAVDARELVKSQPMDLILLDINMGDPNGDSLFEVLGAFHPDTRVIVASVYPVDDQRRLMHAAADYFDKSEGIDILLAKIDKAFTQIQCNPQVQEVKS